MFDIGPAEIAVIVIVAILVFGPDKLPEFARQAGRMLRTVRQMADNAKSDLSREFGDDYTSLRDDLRGLDPRRMLEDDEDDDLPRRSTKKPKPLESGEPAPFDVDAT
ncbi:sec-independent protein translocase protein TatB [Mumia flava]|uniref:Sec-independent protein translocase protein TatB n=1 Tax=Mumia flava TaxID=1348852 RepID=A0A0B2B2N4_9ACTN|nr:sec-independent translocase [Mumia flava]PJJ56707.1 sec-independent protein translocase protein TatB [Mumia flava]